VQLTAQEDAVVSFDPRETGELRFTWFDLIFVLVAGIGVYLVRRALFPALNRVIARHTRMLRYGWPTGMLVWAWLMILLGSRPPSGAFWENLESAMGVTFAILNIPVLIVGGAFLALFGEMRHLYQAFIGSTIDWFVWYGIIRFWEWRLTLNQRISLHLDHGK